jgi:hypothetical protein
MWEGTIKIYLEDRGCEIVEGILLTQDRNQGWDDVNKVTKLWVS